METKSKEKLTIHAKVYRAATGKWEDLGKIHESLVSKAKRILKLNK